jgi:hypothetical protein
MKVKRTIISLLLHIIIFLKCPIPVTAWYESQNINIKSYYYWQRKVREAASQPLTACQQSVNEVAAESKPMFTELALPKTNLTIGAAVIIRFHDAVVEIQNGADFAVVENSLRAVSNSPYVFLRHLAPVARMCT